VPIALYSQPFDAFVVEFPVDWQAANRTPVALGDSVCGGDPAASRPSGPCWVGIVSRPQVLTLAVEWTGLYSVARNVFDQAGEELLIEAIIDGYDETDRRRMAAGEERPSEVGGAPISLEEMQLNRTAVRIALNACLLLTNQGMLHLGPANRNFAARLEDQARRASRRGDSAAAAAARRQRLLLPDYFALQQDLRYRPRPAVLTAKDGEPTGVRLKPHLRGRHWKQQPYGPHNSLRKLILVDSYWVHPEDLGGEPPVFYHKKG
jgi:hypothetical protein